MTGDTMAGNGFQVSTTDLNTHAQSIRQVADMLGQALSAAQQISLDTGAYGVLCGPLFVPPVQLAERAGVAALTAGQAAAGGLRGGIKTTAQNYTITEQGNATSFTGVVA